MSYREQEGHVVKELQKPSQQAPRQRVNFRNICNENSCDAYTGNRTKTLSKGSRRSLSNRRLQKHSYLVMEVRRTFALLVVLSALTLSASASPVICTPLVIDGFKKGCVINGLGSDQMRELEQDAGKRSAHDISAILPPWKEFCRMLGRNGCGRYMRRQLSR